MIVFLFFAGVLSVKIIEQNHHEVTVKVGDEVSLVCTAETQVKACNFRDPAGNTFPIFEGARYALDFPMYSQNLNTRLVH